MSQSARSARLHALVAALCALLLLLALCLMAVHHAPWWALLGVQGALLVTTASAGLWLDRAAGERRRGDAALREQRDPLWWAALERAQNGRQRRLRAGGDGPGDDDDVFWHERMPRERKDER